jgi:hypothetical protein
MSEQPLRQATTAQECLGDLAAEPGNGFNADGGRTPVLDGLDSFGGAQINISEDG